VFFPGTLCFNAGEIKGGQIKPASQPAFFAPAG
jgi:hypothetical protein